MKIRPDFVDYVCCVNGETFSFSSHRRMLDFVQKLHDDGFQINSLSMCKIKGYNLNS